MLNPQHLLLNTINQIPPSIPRPVLTTTNTQHPNSMTVWIPLSSLYIETMKFKFTKFLNIFWSSTNRWYRPKAASISYPGWSLGHRINRSLHLKRRGMSKNRTKSHRHLLHRINRASNSKKSLLIQTLYKRKIQIVSLRISWLKL